MHDPGQILPPAVPVEEARGKVGVHRPPAGHRLKLRVGVGVKLSEEFLDGMQAQGEQQRLVAVIARAHVAGTHRLSQGKLGDLFAVAEDAEFRLAAEDLAPPNQAGLTAGQSEPVVGEHFLARQARLRQLNCLFQKRHGSPFPVGGPWSPWVREV